MSLELRNRVILLALILLIGQLTLVVHATVHDSEISCQLCLTQSHHAKGIPSTQFNIPTVNNDDSLILVYIDFQTSNNPPKAYQQRAPPIISDK
ncbi:MAG: hypothetical protein ACI9XC_001034 [Gammaproteobacteria bacterium]|jgi:hypothetical protein